MKRLTNIVLLLLIAVSAFATDSIRIRSCRTFKNTKPVQTRGLTRGKGATYIGHRRQMVVLVSFADKQFKEENPIPLWDKILNKEGFSEEPFYGSVHDYFYDQSYGQFQLQFDLTYVNLADSCKKYCSTYTDDDNSKYLVYDIVDSLTNRGGIDWAPYDWDGNGYIDQLLIIYAGKGMHNGGDENTIWPHQGYLIYHENGHTKTVSSEGKDYTIDSYCCVNELDKKEGYGSFGTICHEYTHCFNFPDFYNSSGSVIGSWDLMDYGNNNGGGYRPCNYSAHERMIMGWIDIQELSSPTEISNMVAMSDKPQAYLVRNDGYSNEYYVIENRQQKGWDMNLPGSGLVIFHIDYDEDFWEDYFSYINNPNGKKRYTIIPANNDTSVSMSSGWSYPFEGNDSLTNLSEPAAVLINANTDGTYLMSKPITNIFIEDGLAGFVFMAETPTNIGQVSTETQKPEAIYDIHGRRVNSRELRSGVYIIRYENGETRKVVRH